MNRPWKIWLVFAVCLAVVLAATGWVSLTALRLDKAEQQARALAAREENVRLALWRMDSALAPLISQENARPYFAYTAFYPAERAYTRMFAEISSGEVLMPSPLLTFDSPYVLVHVQIGPDGQATSPQVPTSNMRDLAELSYTTSEKINAAAARLAQLAGRLNTKTLARAFAEPVMGQQTEQTAQVPPQGKGADQQARLQVLRNTQEWQQRLAVNEKIAVEQGVQQSAQQKAQPGAHEPRDSLMRPLWIEGSLLLVRRISVGNEQYLQGCQLNWPAIRDWLLSNIRDLLPHADLVPAVGDPSANGERMLAALPVKLAPGALTVEANTAASPIRVFLFIAWGCALLAVGAVTALLIGAVSLSERRAAFVSSVTHELRTPLTTFRMYTEMLSQGMVATEEKRQRYLSTLSAEADRLSHMVENVLAYARLERGRVSGHVERLSLGELLKRAEPRLAERARQSGMELLTEADPAALSAVMSTNGSAVEQILFNLVDNAAKYAAAAADRRVHLRIATAGRAALLRVCDHGPGISPEVKKRLFQPFCKSARDAAHSAPGIGLGLALCRRLARSLGGNLSFENCPDAGACFVLTLPLG